MSGHLVCVQGIFNIDLH